MLDEIRGFAMMLLYSLVDTRVARAVLGSSITIVLSIMALRIFGGFINSPRPIIYVVAPTSSAQISDKQVLVKGRVIPSESQVTINGQQVIANGDGTFSQVIKLVAGENVLRFEAQYYGRKSGIIQTATRILTEEEKAEQTAVLLKEQQKVQESATQLAMNSAKSEVLAAQTTPPPTPEASTAATIESSIDKFIPPAAGMIVTQTEVKNSNEKIITGKFRNATEKTLRWVKIKASFLDKTGSIVDEKTGAVTLVDQHLAPGSEIEYTIPGTTAMYSNYSLSVAYEAL